MIGSAIDGLPDAGEADRFARIVPLAGRVPMMTARRFSPDGMRMKSSILYLCLKLLDFCVSRPNPKRPKNSGVRKCTVKYTKKKYVNVRAPNPTMMVACGDVEYRKNAASAPYTITTSMRAKAASTAATAGPAGEIDQDHEQTGIETSRPARLRLALGHISVVTGCSMGGNRRD